MIKLRYDNTTTYFINGLSGFIVQKKSSKVILEKAFEGSWNNRGVGRCRIEEYVKKIANAWSNFWRVVKHMQSDYLNDVIFTKEDVEAIKNNIPEKRCDL